MCCIGEAPYGVYSVQCTLCVLVCVCPDGATFSGWVGQSGDPQTYWGGAGPGSQQCACGMQENCVDPNHYCNCDADRKEWYRPFKSAHTFKYPSLVDAGYGAKQGGDNSRKKPWSEPQGANLLQLPVHLASPSCCGTPWNAGRKASFLFPSWNYLMSRHGEDTKISVEPSSVKGQVLSLYLTVLVRSHVGSNSKDAVKHIYSGPPLSLKWFFKRHNTCTASLCIYRLCFPASSASTGDGKHHLDICVHLKPSYPVFVFVCLIPRSYKEKVKVVMELDYCISFRRLSGLLLSFHCQLPVFVTPGPMTQACSPIRSTCLWEPSWLVTHRDLALREPIKLVPWDAMATVSTDCPLSTCWWIP